MGKKVLVVAAHPDDEVLGVGGTIARHAASGDIVKILIMAEGLTSRDIVRDAAAHAAELKALHARSHEAASVLGAKSVNLFSFPDNRMDSVDLLDVVKKIEPVVADFAPDICYTHYSGDVNIDHQITNRAVVTACRPIPGNVSPDLYFFETVSSTEWNCAEDVAFSPNVFVDIEPYIEQKMQALKLYASEMRPYPHSRSYEAVEALAKYRGFTVGKKFVEAFALGRSIR